MRCWAGRSGRRSRVPRGGTGRRGCTGNSRPKGVGTSRNRGWRGCMRERGLVARPRRRRFIRTTESGHGYAVAPNVVARQFRPEAPDRVWASDITYVRTASGWLYLAVVLDLFSRRVVGWSMRTVPGPETG